MAEDTIGLDILEVRETSPHGTVKIMAVSYDVKARNVARWRSVTASLDPSRETLAFSFEKVGSDIPALEWLGTGRIHFKAVRPAIAGQGYTAEIQDETKDSSKEMRTIRRLCQLVRCTDMESRVIREESESDLISRLVQKKIMTSLMPG